ncbi:hypothetical protein V6N12_017992 [Hibiscus sabdariffa]|uniref:Uncharacterized protein n=1 Tax=Hibiscus sabdariffa TaxID=183260 RepID=A0ABR2ATM7_9ROSI
MCHLGYRSTSISTPLENNTMLEALNGWKLSFISLEKTQCQKNKMDVGIRTFIEYMSFKTWKCKHLDALGEEHNARVIEWVEAILYTF